MLMAVSSRENAFLVANRALLSKQPQHLFPLMPLVSVLQLTLRVQQKAKFIVMEHGIKLPSVKNKDTAPHLPVDVQRCAPLPVGQTRSNALRGPTLPQAALTATTA
jgi:hypothetical protein